MPHPVAVLLASAQRLSVLLPAILVGLLIESIHRKQPPSSLGLNLRLTTLVVVAQIVTAGTITVAVIRAIAVVPGAGIWIPPQSPWIVVPAWLVGADFCYYWYHRAQHHIPWFWAQHEIHHADEHVNVATAHRHHWLEPVFQTVCVGGPLAYLLAPTAGEAWLIGMVNIGMGLFIHLDVRVTFGRWNWLFASPQSHRLHHALAPEYLDKNFAGLFPVWDVLFGTYVQPPTDAIPTGLHSGLTFTSVVDASLHPFRRWLRR